MLKNTFKVLPVVHENELARIVGLSASDIKNMVIEMADVLNVTYSASTGEYTFHDKGPLKVKRCTNCNRPLGVLVSGQVVKCPYCGMDNVGD